MILYGDVSCVYDCKIIEQDDKRRIERVTKKIMKKNRFLMFLSLSIEKRVDMRMSRYAGSENVQNGYMSRTTT